MLYYNIRTQYRVGLIAILLLSIKETTQFTLIMSLTLGRLYFTMICTLKVFLKIINLYYIWETLQDNCHYIWETFQENLHFKKLFQTVIDLYYN